MDSELLSRIEELLAEIDEDEYMFEHRDRKGIAWDMVEYRSYGNPARPDDGIGVFVMVGDDMEYTFPMSAMAALLPEEYCGSCGQVGCKG